MIDLHCHVLPGIDDGPETIEGSLALARAAAADGTRMIVATPHVSWHHHNDATTIARLTADLNERLSAEGIELEIRTGAEVAMTRVEDLEPDELGAAPRRRPVAAARAARSRPIVTGLDGVVIGDCRAPGIASCSPIPSAVRRCIASRRSWSRWCAAGF